MRLIDADELKNRKIVIDYDEVDNTFDDGLLFVTDLIDKSPTVDAVPVVHGQWILFDKTSGTAVCDQCHRQDHFDLLAKYCRYCGAKMDGKRKGGDE